MFFTEDDNEKSEIWERKKMSKSNPALDETVIQSDAISESIVEQITHFTHNEHRTNQTLLKILSEDAILLQLKAENQ